MGNLDRMPSGGPFADETVDAHTADRILGIEGARAYRRFLGWSVGRGFKLALIEVASPRRRDALVAWTFASYPQACRVSLDQAEQTALIPFLKRACLETEGGAQVLLLTRLDEAQDRIKLCTRLNSQRDELTRAFPMPWVLMVHPSAAQELQQYAPDFSDLVWLWQREQPGEAPDEGAEREEAGEAPGEGAEREEADEAPGERTIGEDADEALGELTISGEAEVLSKLVDSRARATVLRKIAGILEARGQVDEALRLRVEEVLPIYEDLGDERSRAVTISRIASTLEARGQLDEALRLRQEALPVFEAIGDVRSRTITLGKIANLLAARGQLDLAVRVREREELPIYERLGARRSLLVGRTNLALLYLRRGHPGDRDVAAELLRLALEAAEDLGVPEADRIRKIQRQAGLA
jgi:tetratricopeptide (TPR) repeat protein